MRRIDLLKVAIYEMVVCALTMFNCSCEKEESLDTKKLVTASSNIFKFENIEDFQKQLKEYYSLSEEEKAEYEKGKNFCSYARTCEELYKSIDFESFNTVEEFRNIAETYSDYIVMSKDSAGDYVMDVKSDAIPFSCFLNKDLMFQIDNDLYKYVGNDYIIGDVSLKDEMKNITTLNLAEYLEDTTKYKRLFYHKTEQIRDAAYNCGPGMENDTTVGNNRTRIEIYQELYCQSQTALFIVHYLIRPFKKTVAWFWCSRTISCDLNARADMYCMGTWSYQTGHYANTGTLTSKLEGDLIYHQKWNVTETPQMHIGSTDSWASTPSTGPVYLRCNPNLCK